MLHGVNAVCILKKQGTNDEVKEYMPDYYSEFSCVADRCRHSCCKGWEIDVDEDSLKYYASLPENWREKIASNIEVDETGAHFCLTEEERCPFLQENGLCELILGLGEDALCQICTDHPRFRNFFPDRMETGLGLCCEAAGRLILGRKEKAELIQTEDNGETDTSAVINDPVFAFREELLSIAQNRSFSAEVRAEKIASTAGIRYFRDITPYYGFLMSLEHMEEEWTELLHALMNVPPFCDAPAVSELTETAFEQLMVYLLFRHVPDADSRENACEQVLFVLFAFSLIRKLCALKELQAGTLRLDDIVEICRLFSSEIEYSDENKDLIIEKLTEEI